MDSPAVFELTSKFKVLPGAIPQHLVTDVVTAHSNRLFVGGAFPKTSYHPFNSAVLPVVNKPPTSGHYLTHVVFQS